MEKTEEYRGFKIVAHSGQTESGKCWGKYKVAPATKEAEVILNRTAIREFGGEHIETTSDDRATNPHMLDHAHLFENARREIDHLIETDSQGMAEISH
jgi:hypothetical protein